MTKKIIIIFSFFTFFLVGLWRLTNRSSTPFDKTKCFNCNVILISIDSLRADHMSAYGYGRQTTPFMDSLSKKSLVFNKFYATSYLTPISEGSIHTGLYPEKNGIINFKRSFSKDIKTLAEIMKANGYNTMAIGSSHEFRRYKSLEKSFMRGFDIFEIFESRLFNNRRLDLNRFEQLLRTKSDKPFFAWLTIGTVHAPFSQNIPDVYTDKSYTGLFSKIQFNANMQYYYDNFLYDPLLKENQFKFKGNAHTVSGDLSAYHFPAKVNGNDIKYVVDLYDNGVRFADLEVEEIFKVLGRLQFDKNTVVIIQSEHGETLGEHKYIAHYDIVENTTHVPLIITSPALPAAERIDALVSGVDVLPTLLEHLNIKTSENIDGKPFPLAAKKRPDFREEVFLARTPLWEHILVLPNQKRSIFDKFREAEDVMEFKEYGIRSNTRKVIHRKARFAEELYSCWTFISGKKIKREEFEVYDLINDPDEQRPLLITSADDYKLKEKLLNFEEKMSKEARKTTQVIELQEYK